MDVLKELENKKQQFTEVEDQIQQLTDELKRIQGEYRLLVQMGKEQGLIDENGKIVEKEE